VTQSLQTKFAIRITFRQLLGDLASIEALSDFLDSKLPPDVFNDAVPAAAAPSFAISAAGSVPAAVVPASTPSAPTGPVAASAVEQLLRDQLQAMNQLFAQQLAAIHGNAPIPAVTPVNPTAVIGSVPAPQQKTAVRHRALRAWATL